MEKQNVRAVFEKTGRAAYISHLDLMRAIQRAVSRAQLPLWYTQGFNPHVYINLPLALPLGIGSVCEIMDFALTENSELEEIITRLNQTLPEGIKFLRAAAPKRNIKEIIAAEYEAEFYAQGEENILARFNAMLEADKIEVMKRTKKKGAVLTDIKPYMNIEEAAMDGGVLKIRLTLPAGTDFNIGAWLFTDAFSAFCGVNFVKISIIRTKLLGADRVNFV
ncbi:MAG: TIGR03936 family radical SAM-associated protein [Oscillospiraceae bacterium]|nr:TIGR03936 family radical SAM-associated protein [Oscillospiraceae bacterium]